MLSNLNNVGSVEVNAFQVYSQAVIQKSIREGFGLTVSEGLWKARPTVAGRVGGIVTQIEDGVTGWLVDSSTECANACLEIMADPGAARDRALRGKEHVRTHFLTPRLLRDWLALFNRLSGDESAGTELTTVASAPSVKTWIGVACSFAAAVVLGILHYADVSAVTQFVVGIVALALLAWTVGVGTECVGARFGAATTGVLQSTLGNLPELFIVIFSLRAGEIVVAQTSILGSLLANALLVLGLAIVAGAWRSSDGIMRFHRRLPNDTTMLLLLTVFLIAILSTSLTCRTTRASHAVAISSIGALLHPRRLRRVAHELPPRRSERRAGDRARARAAARVPHRADRARARRRGGGVRLRVVRRGDRSRRPGARHLEGVHGLVIVAIAGNAVENVVGVQLAWKRRYDVAISVVKNSVAQIAAFLYPVLVLISLLFDQRLTFAVPSGGLVLVVALVFAALAIWQITGDGEALVYEGLALVATYAVLATVVWYE